MKLALLALLASSACVLEEPDLGESEQDVMAQNKLASNKLASNKLAANKLASNKLAAAAFTTTLGTQQIVDTADGRDVLTYMLQCALGPTQTLTLKDSSGASWSFTGSIGIAPAWTTRALNASEQNWVTGCLLARVNYFGVVVNLSLQGNIQALKTTAQDKPFTSLDGGFYGNLFDPAGPKLYACDGPSTNSLRICADPDPATGNTQTMCGFTATGPCAAGTTPACTISGGDVTCRNALTNAATTLRYKEVVAVYLQP